MVSMAALLLLSGALGSGAPERAPGVAQSVDVEVRAPGVRVAPRRGFSAVAFPDLEFVVSCRRKLAGQSLELWVYTPKGHLYQALKVALPAFRERRKEQAEGEGVKPAGGRAEAVLTFAVRGTLITTNGLYGRWRVEPHLDRDPRPCGKPAAFSILP